MDIHNSEAAAAKRNRTETSVSDMMSVRSHLQFNSVRNNRFFSFQVENLKMEVKKSEQQRKARDKSADTKKMQDLQRQVSLTQTRSDQSPPPLTHHRFSRVSPSVEKVKELEQILRHRNPNSLPALIYAAASAEAAEEADTTKTSAPDKIVALLEHRIQRLEAELESHDEEAKRSLRAMEQRFHGVKVQTEQDICQ